MAVREGKALGQSAPASAARIEREPRPARAVAPALPSVCLSSRLRAGRLPPSETPSCTGYGTLAWPPP